MTEYSTSLDDEEYVMADFNNMDNTIAVSHIPTLRIHKDYPKGQILGDPTLAGLLAGGIFVPCWPAMLVGAAMDQGEESAQPAEPHHTPADPLPSTSLPPHSPLKSPPHSSLQSVPHSPLQSPPYSPLQSPPHSPLQSPPYSPPYSPPHYTPPRVSSLEKELKETNQTLGNTMLKLVKKVKSLEIALKRKSKKVIMSASEGEEPEHQGRIIQDIDDDPLVSLVRKSMKENVSKAKSTNKGKRYRRRARSMAKNINTGLDAEDEINTSRVEINTGIEDEEPELSEQQLKRKAEFQKAAHFYTEEDWDIIRAKLEANIEIDIEDASITKGKDEVVKEEEAEVPVKKTGMRRKQKARKGINIAKTIQDEFNNEREAFMKDKVKDASSESEIGAEA
ncbi:hypothetical protein Tco_1121990 [Tanacetum coccineum]|uniref:Uncharacterized protein n=1 Tax=Tanacetum coccineum TaxID=301880 RepID=A0ABQ5J0N3_9ASTR